jgi:hypothetical protein
MAKQPSTQIPPDGPAAEPARTIDPNWPAAKRPDVAQADRDPRDNFASVGEWVDYYAKLWEKVCPWPRQKIEQYVLEPFKKSWRHLHREAATYLGEDGKRYPRGADTRLVRGRHDDGRWTYGTERHWAAFFKRRRCSEPDCRKPVGRDWLRNGRCNACDLKARRAAPNEPC